MTFFSSLFLENKKQQLITLLILVSFISIEIISFVITHIYSNALDTFLIIYKYTHTSLSIIIAILLFRKNKIIYILKQKNEKYDCISKQSITLLSIENELKEFKKKHSNDLKEATTLTNLLNHFTNNQNNLKKTLSYSYSLNEELVAHLKKRHPSLSRSEIRLCTLIQQGLDSKEIAAILTISPNSVKTSRYRIRKKMNIPRKQNLYQLLNKIANTTKETKVKTLLLTITPKYLLSSAFLFNEIIQNP